MKELDSFTVERLEGLIGDAETWSFVKVPARELKALARIALAVKRDEPVAWEVKGYLCHSKEKADSYIGEPVPLYEAPQLNSQQGWINCIDQMPENSTDVTLFHPEIGVFNGYCWRGLTKDKEPVFFSNSGEHDDGPKQSVTHRMPLPDSPGKPL